MLCTEIMCLGSVIVISMNKYLRQNVLQDVPEVVAQDFFNLDDKLQPYCTFCDTEISHKQSFGSLEMPQFVLTKTMSCSSSRITVTSS